MFRQWLARQITKYLAKRTMKEYMRKEREVGRKYNRHFEADGKVIDLYSNEYISHDKSTEIFKYFLENLDKVNSKIRGDAQQVVTGIMMKFFDGEAAVNMLIIEEGRQYELVIINGFRLDL